MISVYRSGSAVPPIPIGGYVFLHSSVHEARYAVVNSTGRN